ncbi:hypothetical protein RchiOBHm_Chr3g0456141 [Rosa chinensis]|uniref:Uncharacterized protein n=1 Tax=Rosa chinensis TaxID=74649 RepID=A0A2P6R7A3_ROSCH|nr:hypothetical protein RchiOBHm_Chr3g0456141 [Rosa chinensis]
MLLQNPITSRRIRYTNGQSSSPECFNLLEFKMIKLGKSYFLRYILGSSSVCGLKKVILMPAEIVDCAILPYVVDSLGYVFRINVSSEVMMKISSKVIGFGGRKHLVESCRELYVVDMYFDQEQNKQEGAGVEFDFSLFVSWRRGRHQRYQFGELKVVDFKVCKLELLNGELGRWVEVKSLGD